MAALAERPRVRASSSASSSTWRRISSAMSRSSAGARKSAIVRRCQRATKPAPTISRARSRGMENVLDRRREQPPVRLLLGESLLPRGGQRVELRAPPLGRDPPAAAHEPLILETVEGRVERALIHLQHVVRELADSLRDPPTVQRRGEDGLEDQEIERSLQQISAVGHVRLA